MTPTAAPALTLANARIVPGFGPDALPELVDVTLVDGLIRSIEQVGIDGRGPVVSTDSNVERIDLDGRWLIPGLWDEHVHMAQWAKSRRRVDLSAARSAREAVALALAASPATGAVIGRGFHAGLWSDAPDKALLDAAFGDREVVLGANDLHSAWLSTAALRRAGLAEHPTGLLREAEWFRAAESFTEATVEELDAWVGEAGAAAAARGVVGVHDLEMGWNLADWLRRAAAGFDLLRVRSGIYAPDLDRAEEEGLRTGRSLGPLLAVGSFKTITDGSLGTRTAYCVDPYPGSDDHGVLSVPPEELRPLLARAKRIGLSPAVHAIGDEANRLALDAMIELETGGRIEHAQLLRDEDLVRFAAAGIAASVQPEHAMDDRDIAERYWAGRTRRAFPLRTLLDAGATLLFGSDAPVAPLDPWLAIASAVTRSRGGREPWHGEQGIAASEALVASVRTAVAVGQPADLVALDADPLGDPGRLREMPVALTVCAGRVTHGDRSRG